MESRRLYCGLYVDTDLESGRFLSVLANMTGGKVEGRRLSLQLLEVHINRNDAFDQFRRNDPSDGFLYYRYHLDVHPTEGTERPDYVGGVRSLLTVIRKAGIRAIAVCDFEDELAAE